MITVVTVATAAFALGNLDAEGQKRHNRRRFETDCHGTETRAVLVGERFMGPGNGLQNKQSSAKSRTRRTMGLKKE
jgi:hypothetical protein